MFAVILQYFAYIFAVNIWWNVWWNFIWIWSCLTKFIK